MLDRVRSGSQTVEAEERIGIVASEPLATLIRCVVCGQQRPCPNRSAAARSARSEVPDVERYRRTAVNGGLHTNGNGWPNGVIAFPAGGHRMSSLPKPDLETGGASET
jgi:hypothetical protein